MKLKMILPILMIFVLTGCNLMIHGTNTGNPDLNSSPVFGYQGALRLGFEVCAKIQACFPNSDSTACLEQIKNLNGYTSELGATGSSYATLTDLRNAEMSSQVTANQSNFETCSTTIQGLSCSDPLVQNAYSGGAPTNYGSTNLLFRSSGSCAQIY